MENSSNIMEILSSSDAPAKIELLQEIQNEHLDEETLLQICSLLSGEDKGVIDAASIFLYNNGNHVIPNILIPLVSSSNIALRNLVGEILLRIGSGAVDAMLLYLSKGDNDDIKFIIDLFGLIGDTKVNQTILEIFHKNENENVTLACIEALGSLGCTESLSHLFVVYEQNELFRPTVIEALGKIGSKEGLEFIVNKYKEEDELTKFSIVESLGLIGDEETFFFLLSELGLTSGALTWPILSSIYTLKEKFGFDIPFDERMKNSILETLVDAELKYKKVAAYLVMMFNDPDTILASLRVYGSDYELDETIKPKFFENAKLILTKAHEVIDKSPHNLLSLLNLLKELVEYNPNIREEFSPLELRNLTDAISTCLQHPDEEVRQVSIDLIFMIDMKMGIMFIDVMIEDDNMWNRLRLPDILETIDTPESTAALTRLSEDPEEMVSQRAKEILSNRLASGGN
ncbi:MAG: HEAT repeat domain-containing protein [Ignavibacteriaceae bacterium]|nr:HEAT repeat domain-containing protein [Ignavibacteriaceae bacterium]